MIEITAIEAGKKGSYYNIHTASGFAFSADGEDLFEFGLSIGKKFTEEEFEQTRISVEKKKSYRYAVYLLGYKDYSKAEMLEKLQKSKYGFGDEAVSRLVERGYIDDEAYSLRVIEKYIHTNGIRRVVNELFKHKLDKQIWEPLLDTVSENFAQNVFDELYSKLRGRPFSDNKQRDRMYGYFLRHGYNSDDIVSAFEMYRERIGDIIGENADE